MFYLVKTPWWLKRLYPGRTWAIDPSATRRQQQPAAVYLTFDDGPHPEATPFVLDELKKYGAKATFFCIGKNVQAYPEIYKRILMEGHVVGNHTQRHVNGWKVDDKVYIEDVAEARKYIDSQFFRPPYGRLGGLQAQVLRGEPFNFQIIMWDVLSGDFDREIDAARCARNVVRNVRPGSIVVFHDSEKALPRLQGALPATLQHLAKKGWTAAKLD